MELEQLRNNINVFIKTLTKTLGECSSINPEYKNYVVTGAASQFIDKGILTLFSIKLNFAGELSYPSRYAYIILTYDISMNMNFYNDTINKLNNDNIDNLHENSNKINQLIKQMEDPSVKDLYNLNLLAGI